MQYGKSALGKKVIEGATNSPAVAALRWDLLRLDRWASEASVVHHILDRVITLDSFRAGDPRSKVQVQMIRNMGLVTYLEQHRSPIFQLNVKFISKIRRASPSSQITPTLMNKYTEEPRSRGFPVRPLSMNKLKDLALEVACPCPSPLLPLINHLPYKLGGLGILGRGCQRDTLRRGRLYYIGYLPLKCCVCHYFDN